MSEHTNINDPCQPVEENPTQPANDAPAAPPPPTPVSGSEDTPQFPVPDFAERVEVPSFRQVLMFPRHLYYKRLADLQEFAQLSSESKILLSPSLSFSNDALGPANIEQSEVDRFRFIVGKTYNAHRVTSNYVNNKNTPDRGDRTWADTREYSFPDNAGRLADDKLSYSFDIKSINSDAILTHEDVIEYAQANNVDLDSLDHTIGAGANLGNGVRSVSKISKIKIQWQIEDFVRYGVTTQDEIHGYDSQVALEKMLNFIRSTTPEVNQIKKDSAFKAPAAFFTPETQGLPAGLELSDYASVTSFTKTVFDDDLVVPIFTAADAPIEYKAFRSLYRVFADEFMDGALGRQCPQDDINQKFGAEATRTISSVNDSAFDTEPGVEPDGFARTAQPLLDSYVEISFKMHEYTPDDLPAGITMAQKLEELNLDHLILGLLDVEGPSDEKYYTQALDQAANIDIVLADEFGSGTDSENERLTLNYRPRSYENFVQKLELLFEGVDRSKYEWATDISNFPLGPTGPAGEPDLYVNESKAGEEQMFYLFQMFLNDTGLKDHLRRIADVNGMAKNMVDIFNNQYSYSEIIAYRVEKTDASTGEIIQNFYFFNSQDIGEFKFIDTQVYKSKEYVYSIYTINFVIGMEYEYLPQEIETNVEMIPVADSRGSIPTFPGDYSHEQNVYVAHRPTFNIIEAPYHQQEILVEDLPPLPPAVDFETREEKLWVRMSRGQFGEIQDRPIPIRQQDIEIINKMKSAQSNPLTQESPLEITYRSDSIPTHYHLFALRGQPPLSYSDFATGHFEEFSSDYPSKFLRFMDPNLDYFLTFRCRDRGGISNPTNVFKARVVSDGDGTHIEVEPYYFDDTVEEEYHLRQAFSIEPSANQTAINITNSEQYNYNNIQEIFETTRGLDGINLGRMPAEDSIWGRKFAIDIVSTSSGRKITLLLNYSVEQVRSQDWQTTAQRLEAPQEEQCSEKYLSRATVRAGAVIASDNSATGDNDGFNQRGIVSYDRNEYQQPFRALGSETNTPAPTPDDNNSSGENSGGY